MLNQSAENHLYNYKYPLEKYTLLQNYLTEPTLSDDKSLTIYHRWINSWNSHYLIFAINNLYIKMINVKSSIIYCYCIKKIFYTTRPHNIIIRKQPQPRLILCQLYTTVPLCNEIMPTKIHFKSSINNIQLLRILFYKTLKSSLLQSSPI